ncbi:50S ribosomal protein L11 [Candidatus Lokiarchaeum ossiferum]|uniref:Large ribosomal subunit protein uL11 n=1 Tax=Candidatus Lokiarchaeum ossiferum TaxID=2951803 RepID=A0ABY6HYH7_9ARCH|nr:50S ribosomal protein L11 [Candidatus Lokiarchaeum sp. B-35]
MADILEVAALVEGGKASGGPPIGPAVGPTGVPIKNVVDTINEKTKDFKGLKVPVTILINKEDKTFEIKVSTPMASALLLKECGISKGSGEPTTTFVGDLSFEQILKIARMKRDSLNALNMKTCAKTIIGTAFSCGIKIDGKTAREVLKNVDDGQYDDQLAEGEN